MDIVTSPLTEVMQYDYVTQVQCPCDCEMKSVLILQFQSFIIIVQIPHLLTHVMHITLWEELSSVLCCCNFLLNVIECCKKVSVFVIIIIIAISRLS